ncbi:MAG TPA: hypothetical protein VF756_11635, partial [Thermoanaerobaculia bacterium]
TAAEPERERTQGSSTPAPVFSLRSHGSASVPVPRTEPRASTQSPHPLAPSPVTGRGGKTEEKQSGGGAPLPVTGEGTWVRVRPQAGEVGGALELLSRLADDVLRERDAPPGIGFPVPPVLRLRETVPPGKKEPGKAAPFPSPDRSALLPEISTPAPAAVRDVEPVDLGTLARRGVPALPTVEEESSVKAMLGATVAVPKRPTEIPAADSSFESPFEAEALADLVNEALIEQARRHGVDLS